MATPKYVPAIYVKHKVDGLLLRAIKHDLADFLKVELRSPVEAIATEINADNPQAAKLREAILRDGATITITIGHTGKR